MTPAPVHVTRTAPMGPALHGPCIPLQTAHLLHSPPHHHPPQDAHPPAPATPCPRCLRPPSRPSSPHAHRLERRPSSLRGRSARDDAKRSPALSPSSARRPHAPGLPSARITFTEHSIHVGAHCQTPTTGLDRTILAGLSAL